MCVVGAIRVLRVYILALWDGGMARVGLGGGVHSFGGCWGIDFHGQKSILMREFNGINLPAAVLWGAQWYF